MIRSLLRRVLQITVIVVGIDVATILLGMHSLSWQWYVIAGCLAAIIDPIDWRRQRR